ncbi:MAG TPA: DoxX family protein [Acidimicrobiales bacterium]|nr:DoxX family protein [Acidimicrobiales bacterium]
MDTGMLLIRVTIGILLVGHGAQHGLGWFGGYGADGTGAWLEGFGFRQGRRTAVLLGVSEIAVGTMFGAGLLVPLAAAGIVGITLAAAMTDHAGKGPWIWKGGYEYVLVLGVVAVSVAFAGPGAVSLDDQLGLDLSGTGWGIAAAAAGVASGFGVLATRAPGRERAGELSSVAG